MEKAEGYAELFGLSMEAFQRVDFNYLAQAISEMNTNSDALNSNMALLKSGQTTQTKEQQKIAEINKTLIEEGLSYVLDNQVGRAIQENMWAEQRARQMMEATYGVEVKGALVEAVNRIVTAVENIINLLNPFKWFQKAGNLVGSLKEANAQDADIRAIL